MKVLKIHRNIKKRLFKIQNIAKLNRIFAKNQWDKKTESGNNQFDRFCEMLEYFNENQQRLIIDLTSNFIQVGLADYIRMYTNAFLLLLDRLPTSKNYKKLIFFPATMPEDMNKSKSAQAVLYMIKGELATYQRKVTTLYLKTIDNYNMLEAEDQRNESLICLVDDFVGTGQTALNVLEELKKRGFNKNQLYVTALVAQESGINALEGYGVPGFASIIRKRGISDNPKYTECDMKIMESIEAKIGVREPYKLGYGHSEALVKMIRTPNNTFPVYWLQKRKGNVPIVPFPR